MHNLARVKEPLSKDYHELFGVSKQLKIKSKSLNDMRLLPMTLLEKVMQGRKRQMWARNNNISALDPVDELVQFCNKDRIILQFFNAFFRTFHEFDRFDRLSDTPVSLDGLYTMYRVHTDAFP